MTLDNDDPRVLARRNVAMPTVYCTIMNSNYASCDDCRRKTPVVYNGREWFCISKVVELRFMEEMLESKRNLQMGFSTNYLIEAKREKDDNDEDGTAGRSVLQPTNGQPVDQMGVHGSTVEPIGDKETSEIVGECCNC
jgi:hypothetical protein